MGGCATLLAYRFVRGSRPGDLFQLRHGERGRQEVLHRVRGAPRRGLSELRDAQPAGRQVLRRVRDPADRAGRRGPTRPRHRPPTAPSPRQPSAGSCRVLFADLVGFTPFAEERDAEDVRETLSSYFEIALAR